MNAIVVFGTLPTTIVAVGDSGTVVISRDSGRSWRLTALGSGNLNSIVRSPRTLQLIAAGDGGKLLVSDDNGETWFSIASGTTANLSSIAADGKGGELYTFGTDGVFEKNTPLFQRGQIDVLNISHVLTSFTVDLSIHGVRPNPPPTFTVRAIRTTDVNRTSAIDFNAESTVNEVDNTSRSVAFSLSGLNPHPGESFDLQLCLHQGYYSRCIPLPRVTSIPWLDVKKNAAWLIPVTVICGLSIILECLLYIRPLWILALYRRTSIYELLEHSSIPGASLIRAIIQKTLLPWFAFHHRTLNAWTLTHRIALNSRWEHDAQSYTALNSRTSYISLPVELRTGEGLSLITDPSTETILPLLLSSSVIEIRGPGGIGKTTLLLQCARWLEGMTSKGNSGCNPVGVIALETYSDNCVSYVARKLSQVTDEDVSEEFVRHLLKSGSIALFVDGFTELPSDFKSRLRQDLASMSRKLIVLSTREPADIDSMSCIGLYPKPLDSRTLLFFITALLSELPEEMHSLNTMEFQLELGSKIAKIMNTAGTEVPLTPLLARLYVERATELLKSSKSLDDLPSSVAEAYFEFIRLLLRAEDAVGQMAAVASIKTIGRLCLGDRFIPSKLERGQVLKALEPATGDRTLAVVNALLVAGLLSEEEVGLTKTIFFLLDPVAEFCAAYAYMELLGSDLNKWRTFQSELNQLGTSVAGFRIALNLVTQSCSEKGLCSPEAAALIKWTS